MSADFSLSPLIDLPPDTFSVWPYEVPFDQEIAAAPVEVATLDQNKIITILTQDPLGLSSEQALALSKRIIEEVKSPTMTTFKVKGSPKEKKPTFWIAFDPISGQPKIQVNIPGTIVGKGSYKIIKGGIEIMLPSCTLERYVRWRPREHVKQKRILRCVDLHNELYRLLHDPQKGVRISSPPHVRQDKTGSLEPIQPYYPYVLDKLSATRQLSLYQKITICFEIFCTVQAFHTHGYVVKDVKSANILVDSSFSSYLNDLDICTKKFFGVQSNYVFWDIATKKGLITPYCDVVGTTLTMLEVIFPKKRTQMYKDKEHQILSSSKSLEGLYKTFAVDASPHAPVLRKILALAVTVLKTETTVHKALLASMRRYFTNDKSALKRWTFERFQKCQVTNSEGVTFAEILLKKDKKPNTKRIKFAVKRLVGNISKNKSFAKRFDNFFAGLNKANKRTLRDIAEEHVLITSLLFDKETSAEEYAVEGSETLFKNIHSQETSDRLAAFEELEKIAPSMSSIKAELTNMLTLIK